MARCIAEAMKNQFDSTYKMAAVLVDICPDDIWLKKYDGTPFWLYVYHIVFFMDFWFRDKYGDNNYKSMIFDERITPQLDAKLYDNLFVSRDEMKEYLALIHEKTTCIFDALSDEKLAAPITDEQLQYTYTDIVLGQIRHVMYNVGYLNGILRRHGLPASEWYAYNEPEGS